MNYKSKIFILVVLVLLAAAVTGCTSDNSLDNTNDSAVTGTTSEVTDNQEESVAPEPPEGGMPDGMGNMESPAGTSGVPTESAIFIEDGSENLDKEYSQGEYSSYITEETYGIIISDIELTDGDYEYNGIVAIGADTIVTLRNSIIALGVDSAAEADATGGSAIAVDDGATMYITDSELTVDGAGRYVTSVYNDGTIIVNDSVVTSTGNNENTNEIDEPFSNEALLISGTARSNFSIGQSDTYYFNSTCNAEGWAALSTDSATGDGLDLYAYNTTATAQNGGYSTYADTNCRVWLYGSTLESAEVGAIIAKSGQITVADGASVTEDVIEYNQGETTDAETTITAGRNAIMLHTPDMSGAGASAADCGTLNVINSTLETSTELESTLDYTEKYGDVVGAYVDYVSGSAILLKSTSANINLENAVINSYNNALIMTALNSDSMGNFLAEGDADTSSVKPISVTMSDMDVTGDIKHMDYQRIMNITLDNTTMTGAVVSGTLEDWQEIWSDYDSEDLNWMPDESWSTVYGANMTVKNGSTWNVTGESSLSSLTIEDSATVNLPDGYQCYVNGVVTQLTAGEYTGSIVISDNYEASVSSNNAVSVEANVEEGSFVGVIPEEGLVSNLGQVTLTVNGVETKIVPNTEYSEDDNAYVSITNAAGDYASETASGSEDYRTGLFISESGFEELKSVTEAVSGGSYDDSSAQGISIDSNSDNFNGIMLVDAGEYTVSDSDFNFLSTADGSNTLDFTAYGTVLSAFGNSRLIVDNVTINTEGVARCAVVADDGADVLVTDSDISVAGGTVYEGYENTANTKIMVTPPWVLGISGTARSTNMLGNYSTSTFVNSNISASDWGVLSTDGCSNVVLTAIDSTLDLTGDSGYGTYAIGEAKEYFYGTTMNVATFANIITGGYVTYASSEGTFTVNKDDEEETTVFEDIEGEDNNSVVNSDAFGIMWHGSGDANILDGTIFNTENAIFLIKNGTVNINVDNSELNTADGIILQMMDNDDSVVGVQDGKEQVFNTEFSEEEGYPGIDNDVIYSSSSSDTEGGMPEGEGPEGMPEGDMPEGMQEGEGPEGMPEGEMPEGDMPEGERPEGMSEGDMPEKMQEGERPEGMPEGDMPSDMQSMGAGEESSGYSVTANFTNVTLEGNMYNATGYVQSAKTLLVTLGSGAELTGAISATSAIHSTDGGETQNTYFTIDEYYKLGHVANQEYYNGSNDVSVVIEDGGVWNVTELSYITSLTVEDGGTINGTVEVDGTKINVEAGETYTGTIVVTPAGEYSSVLKTLIIIAAIALIIAVASFILLRKNKKQV